MNKGIRFNSEVAERLGICTKSLYTWKAQFSKSPRIRSEVADQAAEIRRLKRELARVTEERTILKKGVAFVRHWSEDNGRARTSRASLSEVRLYSLPDRVMRSMIPRGEAHRAEFSARSMCRVLTVHFSGFHAWLKEPLSTRALEDARQTELIQKAWADSGKVCGYRKLTDDLRDAGETCSENRVARLASLAGIAAQIGYRRRPGAMAASLLSLPTTP